jgi:hypothetical protein
MYHADSSREKVRFTTEGFVEWEDEIQPEIELKARQFDFTRDWLDGEYNSILAASAFSRRLKPTIIFSTNCLLLDSNPYPFGIR